MRQILVPLAAAVLFAGCAAPAATAADTQATARTITVTGEGRASAAPDMAVISIGVQSEAKTAAAALTQNSQAMTATIAQLKKLGVADKDVQTSGLSINPRYDYEQNRSAPPIVGYTASNTVTVRLRDLTKAGGVIDQAVQSGANNLNGISFTFADPKPMMDEARKDAVSEAKARAKLLTDAAGVSLGQLVTIQDGYASQPSPQPMYAARAMKAESDVPLEAGESSITATVTLVYEIK